MDIDRIRTNPAFRQMEPVKQQMVEELMRALSGRQLKEALPVIAGWQKKMEQTGLSFTPQENKLLTEIFTAQMTPAQKKQYALLKQWMKKQ